MLVELALSLALASSEVKRCAIVYGKTWAFVSDVPAGWQSACGQEAVEGSALTLWPDKQKAPTDGTLIYVSISDPDPKGLDDFVTEDLSKFKAESSNPSEISFTKLGSDSPTRMRAKLINGPEHRREIIVYISDPHVFYIVVMSTPQDGPTTEQEVAFEEFLKSFHPMSVKFKSDG